MLRQTYYTSTVCKLKTNATAYPKRNKMSTVRITVGNRTTVETIYY